MAVPGATGRAAIHLLCAQETRDHADSFAKACWRAKDPSTEQKDATIRALREFTASLRKEIGSNSEPANHS
ncbi:hypothetical protein AB0L88_17630 [Saccharopolyspora shandongensis]|uniref:hypothetical protein n=1 Tax=Saccharopolyspora shandongensis TaxID=418495 RepID=UPI0034464CBB